MANLSREEAIQLIKEPKNTREIQKAKAKRIRHKLHTEPDADEINHLGEPHTRFLSWVQSVLKAEDNYSRFRQLYRPPITTNELTESIFSEFEKVFEAQNSFEKFQFTDSELENDFAEYRKRIGDFNFWETQGFECFKNSIDNILVIDLPALQIDANGNFMQPTDKPEPYYYLLDIDNIIDVQSERVNGDESQSREQFYFFRIEYLIFRGEGGYIYVFDDTYYRRFKFLNNDTQKPILDSEVAHGLNYTPARSFWTTPLNSTSTIQKRSPVTNSISELDWYLFFSIAQKYLELYAPFPIYAVYKSKCNYQEKGARAAKCVDGILAYAGQVGAAEKCPACSSKIKVGPGQILQIDIPQDKSDDFDLMANPMKVIPAEITSLDYVKKQLTDRRNEIFANCVGRGTDAENNQAVNELQIQSGFESRTSVLLKIKRNFEIIHQFTMDTVARLRYGDKFISASINYGDQFFVKDESAEVSEYESAVKNGLPAYELSTRREAIYNARYRNNPDLLERLTILRHLEPFPDNNISQLQDIRSKNPELVPLKQMVIKINFNSLIDKFEREQANILIFASATTFDMKINAIAQQLGVYADEMLMPQGKPAGPASTDETGQPSGAAIETPNSVEAEAKAKLKGSVGGVQGILEIQKSVSEGITDYQAAVTLLYEIFGFDRKTAMELLGDKAGIVISKPNASNIF